MHSIRLSSPAAHLREYIRIYGQRKVRTDGATVVHSVPARAFPLLEFVFGDPFQVMYPHQSLLEASPHAVVVGPQTHCRCRLQFQGTVECFVILFQPTGLHRLFSIPVHELTDHAYEAHSVLGTFVSGLECRLAESKDFRERVGIADQFISSYSLKPRGSDRISTAASKILSAYGNSRVSDLAHDADLSVRQFERRFIQQVGVHPKMYARIVRFEAALDRKARSSTKSWTDLAHEFGYYDQMHMVHDFEGFTGTTPTQMLKEVEALFREQIEAIRSGQRFSNAGCDPELIL